jgi:pimeloyl-ACP methyl ester carboxylesterase
MTDLEEIDFSAVDRPEVLHVLFHPRPDWGDQTGGDPDVVDMDIPVAEGVTIGARFHSADAHGATILFFHGNGEIVSDYDALGPVYRSMGLNFLAVDYRGYGRSTGRPSVTHMMRDCHRVFRHVGRWLTENGYQGPTVVMGRSLGSASAMALAAAHPGRVAGLIIESGFAYAAPLLRRLGVDMGRLGVAEDGMPDNLKLATAASCPLLVIHAENDHIIPIGDGEAIYAAGRAENKRFLKIPGADHNTLMAVGLEAYMRAIAEFISSLT